MKRTKIVATIGPASMSKQKLKKMVQAGMNVCRLNFSHSDHLWHRKAIKNIRAVEKETGRTIGILADLQGPRIRVANPREMQIKKGETILVTDMVSQKKSRRKKKLLFDWDNFFQYIKPGAQIFIEDGLMQLQVEEVTESGCLAKVMVGGIVKPHKAVNIPSISSKMDALTDKDLSDLEFAIAYRVDMIAMSFVGNAMDVHKTRKLIEYFIEYKRSFYNNDNITKQNYKPWIISKIERRLAIKNLREIIKASDGIMIARGDLAIEMPQKKVALLELDILKKTRRAHKPVIVATQMLASMENNSRPTRAEIADVTNAVINHTDAVMLSGESAMGKYPVKTVETMAEIIKTTEKSKYDNFKLRNNRWAKLLFGINNKKRRVKTAKDLNELLKLSSLRQEQIKLRLSKRKLVDWGRASLVWGVDTKLRR